MELLWVILRALLGITLFLAFPVVWLGAIAHCFTRKADAKMKGIWMVAILVFPIVAFWYWCFSATRRAPADMSPAGADADQRETKEHAMTEGT